MSLGGAASYYGRAVPTTSDPFQFAVGRYPSPDGLTFDMKQSPMMYGDRRCGNNSFSGASSSFSGAPAFDASASLRKCEYVPPSPSYPMPGHVSPEYGTKTLGLTSRGLAVGYGQGHPHSTSINHVGTSPQTGLQPGFAIYPWMRSMTTGKTLLSLRSL